MQDTGSFVTTHDWGGQEGRCRLVSVSLVSEEWSGLQAFAEVTGAKELVYKYCRFMLLEVLSTPDGSALYVEERYADEVIAMLKTWEEGAEDMEPYNGQS